MPYVQITCPRCDGSGVEPPELSEDAGEKLCAKCGGRKTVRAFQSSGEQELAPPKD